MIFFYFLFPGKPSLGFLSDLENVRKSFLCSAPGSPKLDQNMKEKFACKMNRKIVKFQASQEQMAFGNEMNVTSINARTLSSP